MLDVFRNSAKGTAGKVIVGLIVITFVLFGAESIISIAGNTAPVTVNGEDISAADYQNLQSSRQQELTAQYGAEVAAQIVNAPFFKEELIETLVNQELQSQLVSELALDVSEDKILKELAAIPAFNVDGKFDQDMYQNILSANGMNHQSFVASQRAQLALNQMQTGIVDSAFVLDKTIDRYAELFAQQRSIRYKAFNAADFADQVELTDDELVAYYEENQNAYLSDEQVKVKYLNVTLADIADEIIVLESEVESAYDSYVAGLQASIERNISHILFADGDDAESEAQATLERINAGESFADLAIELSDDPGSAEFGGSLGQLIPDVYVQEFYDAAIALEEEGQVSDLVTTQYGIHLIRLDSLAAAEPETFEQKQAELTEDLKLQKAREEMLLVESQLSDEAFASDFIEDVAEVFQAEVVESDWLTRNGDAELFADAQAIEAAFSAQVIDEELISNVVRLSSGDLLVMQKLDYQAEEVKPFDAVKDEVVAELTATKSAELMAVTLAALAETGLADGEGWIEFSELTRISPEVPQVVVTKAYELALPETGSALGVTEGDETAYAVELVGVTNVEPDEEQMTLVRGFASQSSGAGQYQAMFNKLLNEAKVEVR